MGKGGGGGPAPAPSSQTVTQTTIPEYARPYAEKMLGQSDALTDIDKNPYQAYGGQRIAGFNPMQEQAFADVQNRQTSSQLGQGSTLAGASGLASFGAGSNYQNLATNPQAQAAYMSPYMQNVVDVQKNEAVRDAQIRNLSANLASASSRQGTYGGARQLLAEGERNRNLQQGLANIQATGSQNAFQQAQQAQQFGTTAGLQGFNQATQAANALGQLGQTQFGQESTINQGKQQVGAVQQAQAQQGLDLGYQDFLNQRNFPYQQLAFQSDLLRGIPSSQSAKSIYEARPNAASQLGGLGLSALSIYGQSGGFRGAEGGMIKGYANGGLMAAQEFVNGGSVAGIDINALNVEQLTKMLENPALDQVDIATIEQRIRLLTRMANNPAAEQIMNPVQQPVQYAGIDSIPTGDMVPQQMAGGGIIAFANGGNPEDAYQKFLEAQVRKSIENQVSGNAYKRYEDEKSKFQQDLKASQENDFYRTIGAYGKGLARGKSPDLLTNAANAASEAVDTYSQLQDKKIENAKELLQSQFNVDKADDARRSGLTGQMQNTLGQLQRQQLTAAAIRANAGDPELKALQKAQALINNNDDIPELIKERNRYDAGSPNYNAYNKEINAIRNAIFAEAGVKRKPIATPGVQLPPEPEKEPGFFSRLNPFSSSKPVAPARTPGTMKFDKSGNPV